MVFYSMLCVPGGLPPVLPSYSRGSATQALQTLPLRQLKSQLSEQPNCEKAVCEFVKYRIK